MKKEAWRKLVKTSGNKYILNVFLTLALVAGATIAMCLIWPENCGGLLIPIMVALGFIAVETVITVKVWQWVMIDHKSYLTHFLAAQSPARLLSALAVMLIEAIIVGRDAMEPYVMSMLLFYVLSLLYHIRFFKQTTHRVY